MIGPMDFVLGGLVPLAVAAVAYAAALRMARSATAAWTAGVIAGFAAGALAMEARDSGLATATSRLLRPTESQEWLPLLGLAAAIPAIVGRLAPGSRWLELLAAAPLCVAAPARLLWSKYHAAQQLRDAGFTDDAMTLTEAAAVVGAIALGTLVAWALWQHAQDAELPKTRSLLAIVATIGASATAALTGSLVVGQLFGVLAGAIGGCAATAWLLGDRSGPEAARGPTLVLFASLLAVAATYSRLHVWQAAALAGAFVLPGGPIAGLATVGLAGRVAIRALVCLLHLGIAVGAAAAAFSQ